MRDNKPNPSSATLAAVNLAIAEAQLKKLKRKVPEPRDPRYTRFEDLQPLKPEERGRLKDFFYNSLKEQTEQAARKKHDWYMSMAHHAP